MRLNHGAALWTCASGRRTRPAGKHHDICVAEHQGVHTQHTPHGAAAVGGPVCGVVSQTPGQPQVSHLGTHARRGLVAAADQDIASILQQQHQAADSSSSSSSSSRQ